jgi:hypothetical protein
MDQPNDRDFLRIENRKNLLYTRTILQLQDPTLMQKMDQPQSK